MAAGAVMGRHMIQGKPAACMQTRRTAVEEVTGDMDRLKTVAFI